VFSQFLRRQYAGCVPLSEHENFVLMLQKAREDKMEADRLKKEAKHSKEESEVSVFEGSPISILIPTSHL